MILEILINLRKTNPTQTNSYQFWSVLCCFPNPDLTQSPALVPSARLYVYGNIRTANEARDNCKRQRKKLSTDWLTFHRSAHGRLFWWKSSSNTHAWTKARPDNLSIKKSTHGPHLSSTTYADKCMHSRTAWQGISEAFSQARREPRCALAEAASRKTISASC